MYGENWLYEQNVSLQNVTAVWIFFFPGFEILKQMLSEERVIPHLPLAKIWEWQVGVACRQTGHQRLKAIHLLLKIVQCSTQGWVHCSTSCANSTGQGNKKALNWYYFETKKPLWFEAGILNLPVVYNLQCFGSRNLLLSLLSWPLKKSNEFKCCKEKKNHPKTGQR